MQRFMRWSLLAVWCAGVAVAEEERKQDHDALRQIRKVFEEAVASNDMDTVQPYLATNFVLVTYTDSEFTDFAAFVAQWQKTRSALLGDTGSYRVDLNPEYSVLLGDLALCRGNAKNVLVDDKGKEFTFDSHWSAVCQKQDGQWRILRGHNSLNPFYNPMLVYSVKAMLKKMALLAFLLGVVAGILATWTMMRKRAARPACANI